MDSEALSAAVAEKKKSSRLKRNRKADNSFWSVLLKDSVESVVWQTLVLKISR